MYKAVNDGVFILLHSLSTGDLRTGIDSGPPEYEGRGSTTYCSWQLFIYRD